MTFDQLDNLYRSAKETGRAGNLSLEQFAAVGARQTGDPTLAQVAQAGPVSNKFRQLNSMLNRGVNATGLDEFLGNQVGNLAEMVGVNRQTGVDVGQSLPRVAVDVAPLALAPAAVALAAPAATVATLGSLGLAASSALSGMNAYGQSGSLGQAGVAAATPFFAGELAKYGGQAAMNYAAKGTSPFLKALGVTGGTPFAGKLVTETLQGGAVLPGTTMAGRVLETMPDKIFNYLGQQAAVEGGLLGLDVVTQGKDAVFNKDYLFSNVIGNLAFAGLDVGDFRGKKLLPGETYTAPEVRPATEFMTKPEKSAFDFRQVLGDAATAADRAILERSMGLDVARQANTENLIVNQQKLLQDEKNTALGKLTQEWDAQKAADLSTPDLAPTLVALSKNEADRTDVEKFIVQRVAVNPALGKLIDEHKTAIKKAESNHTRSLNRFQLSPNEETLFGVLHDNLKLSPEFLAKPVADRTQEDYGKALAGKLTHEGWRIVQGIHRQQAGLPHVIGENVPYDNYVRAMTDKSVKLNDPLGVVAAVAAAHGTMPKMTDKKVKAVVDKAKDQGKTAKEVKDVVEQQATKEVKKAEKKARKKAKKRIKDAAALVATGVEIVPAKRGRPAGQTKKTQESASKALGDLAETLKSPKPEEAAFAEAAYNMVSGMSEAEPELTNKMFVVLGKLMKVTTKLPMNERLAKLQTALETTKQRWKQSAVERGKILPTLEEGNLQLDQVVTNVFKGDDVDGDDAVDLVHEALDEKASVVESDDSSDAWLEARAQELAQVASSDKRLLDLIEHEALGRNSELLDRIAELRKQTARPDLVNKLGILTKEGSELSSYLRTAVAAAEGGQPMDAKTMANEIKMADDRLKGQMWAKFQKWKKDGSPVIERDGDHAFRLAASEGAEPPQVGFQKLKSVEEWMNSTLEKSGVEEKEIPLYKQAWLGLVKMFQSPEVMVGKLTGKESEAKFARAAGGGFNFGMADVVDGKLLRPTGKLLSPAKDGTLSELEFRVNGGLFGPLQKDEVEFYKMLVPEAFKGERVHVQKLWDGLGKVGEQVKIVTYGQDGQVSEAKQQLDKLTHDWYDNLSAEVRLAVAGLVNSRPELIENERLSLNTNNLTEATLDAFTPELWDQIYKYAKLKLKVEAEPHNSGPRATSYYNQISPFDTKKFPVLRVDVVLPERYVPNKFGGKDFDERGTFWMPDNLHENLPNTLGWAMVQIVPHPVTGEKVMFVGEMQSRWGQTVQKENKGLDFRGQEKEWLDLITQAKAIEAKADQQLVDPSTPQWLKENATQNKTRAIVDIQNYQAKLKEWKLKETPHPLLPIHQNLILKSVIQEAQKQGISKVAVSDGETAMMTEGHDKAANSRGSDKAFQTKELAAADAASQGYKLEELQFNGNARDGYYWETLKKYPSQEGGMRLAYDTTAPSIMKKLVGEGTVEDFGEHKNAVTAVDDTDAFAPIGSPVFRTPAGTPKTNATARVYDITSPSERTGYLFAKQNLGTVYAAALEKQRQIFFNPEALAKLSPTDRLAVTASLLSHEHAHIFTYKAKQGEFGPEAKKLIEDYETWVKTTDPQNVTDLVDVMAELHLGKDVKKLPGVEDVIRNLRNNRGQMDTDEVLANLLGVYAAGMNKVKEPSRLMTLMPKVVRDAFDWISQKLQSVSHAVRLYTKLGFDREMIKKAQGVAEVFDAARRGARKAEENMEKLAVMANLTPGDVVELGGRFAEGERYGVSGKPKAMAQSFLNNWIFKPAEVFRPHEFLHKPFAAMTDVGTAIGDETAVALAPMVGHLGVKNRLYVDKDTAWFRIRKSEHLSKLTNVINLDMQKAEKAGTGAALEVDEVGGWKWNTAKLSPESRARWAQASKEQQELIAGFFAKRQISMKHTQGVILNAERGKYVSDLGKMIAGQKAMEGRFGEGEGMAQAIMDALASGDQVALSKALMATPDETVRPQLLELAKGYQDSLEMRRKFYDERPNFSSLRRFGAAIVKYVKGGKEETISYHTAAEAEAGETVRVQEGWEVKSVKLQNQGKPEYKSGLDPELKKMLYEKEKRLRDLIGAMPIDEGLRAELMSDLNFSEKLEISEAAKDITSVRAERKFAAGMEHLDVFEQDMLYITKAIRAAKLGELKAKVNAALRHPEAEMVPDVVATFKQVFENLLTPSNPWLQKMSKANAAWFLGMNLPGHFAELLQPVMTHLPELRAMGVSTWEGAKMIRQAQKEIAKVYAKAAKDDLFGKTKGTQHLADYWDKSDPEVADLLRKMVGKIDQGPLSGAYQDFGFDQGQLQSVIDGGKPKNYAEMVASPFNMAANASLKFYSLFTQHNAISALITGYRAARKLGMSHDEAVARAGLFDTTVNKAGGKANRQASAYKGDALLGHIFYSLQGYSTGWFGQLAMYYKQGFNKNSYPKLSPTERANAKAAFRNMLVAQVGMAGLMGLPFMGAGMALLEELTGEDLRSKLYGIVDEATGDPIIANMATHGMSSAIADSFGLPVDLHSRFALGGFLGLNSYDGFSASSLFGPTASMVNGMWNMGKTIAQEHDVGKALALGGPTGLKNMAKALSEEVSPTTGLEPTMTGTLIKSLGFKSGPERKLQELKKIAMNLNNADSRQMKQMAEGIASQLGRGPKAVQAMLLASANKLATGSGQEYQLSLRAAVKSLAQKVSQVVEAQKFPTDYRELATRRTAGSLQAAAQSMGLELPQSPEVQKEMLKMAVYQSMGLSYKANVSGALERQQLAFR